MLSRRLMKLEMVDHKKSPFTAFFFPFFLPLIFLGGRTSERTIYTKYCRDKWDQRITKYPN